MPATALYLSIDLLYRRTSSEISYFDIQFGLHVVSFIYSGQRLAVRNLANYMLTSIIVL